MRVAVLGIGIMGAHMAVRLCRAGHEVAVWNRSPGKADKPIAAGAREHATLREAVADCEAAIVMVFDGAAVDNVLTGTAAGGGGILEAMPASGAVMVMSSITPHEARAQASAAADRGLAYVDAPVSGGEAGARDGTLAIMAGGDAQVIDRLGPVWAPLGRVTRVGAAGAGSLAKQANQAIVGGTLCAIAEAIALVEAGGGDAGAFIDAVAGGFADGPLLRNHGRRMVARDFRAGGTAQVQLKDMRGIVATGQAEGLELAFAQLAAAFYAELVESGDGGDDHNAVFKAVLRRAGKPV